MTVSRRAIRLIVALVLVLAAASACSSSGTTSKIKVHGTVTVDDMNPLGSTTCGSSGWRIKVANSSGKVLTVINSALPRNNHKGTCLWRYAASLPSTSVYTFTVEDSDVIKPLTVNRSDIKNGKVPDLYGVA